MWCETCFYKTLWRTIWSSISLLLFSPQLNPWKEGGTRNPSEATVLFLCSYVMTSHMLWLAMLWHPTFYQWGVRNSCNLLRAFKGKEHALFLHISSSSWTEDVFDHVNLTGSLENIELWLRKSEYIKNPLYPHGLLSPVHAIEEKEEMNFLPYINFVCL